MRGNEGSCFWTVVVVLLRVSCHRRRIVRGGCAVGWRAGNAISGCVTARIINTSTPPEGNYTVRQIVGTGARQANAVRSMDSASEALERGGVVACCLLLVACYLCASRTQGQASQHYDYKRKRDRSSSANNRILFYESESSERRLRF
jgi:hypothetical protein